MPCNTRPTRATQVTKAIGCPHLELVQGEGYWYFVFDDPARNLYQTKSVMVNRLYKLSLLSWIEEGDELVKSVEQGYADRQEREAEKATTVGVFVRGGETLRPYQQAAIDALRHAGVADAAQRLWMRNTGPMPMLRDWLINAFGSAVKEAASGNPPRIEYKGRDTNEATKTADLYLSKVLTNPPHPDVADAAWFLIDRTTYGGTGEFAERILRDTTCAGIINDARRHGFNPESDRRLYSGRVVPWELIDAAKGVITAQLGTLADEHAAIERLRKALKDL